MSEQGTFLASGMYVERELTTEETDDLRRLAEQQQRLGTPRTTLEEFQAAQRDPKVHAAIARALAEGEELDRQGLIHRH